MLNRATSTPSTSTQLHSVPPNSTHLHPALCNTLNVIRIKILLVFGHPKFRPKNSKLSILTENWRSWYLWGVDSESGLRFLKFRPQDPFLGKLVQKVKVVRFTWKLAHSVPRGCWFLFQHEFSEIPNLNVKDADFYSDISFLKFQT